MPKSFNLFLIAVFILSCPEMLAQGFWKELSSPVNSLLRKVFFVDSSNGWACGSEGIIIHTSDSGNNWEIQNSNVESFIVDVFFLNKNSGFALTQRNSIPFGTTILKTSDSGNTWSNENYFENNVFMNTVFFFDSLNGFLGGSYIAKTTNGGASWSKAIIDSSFFSRLPIYSFDFYNRQFGFACGGALDLAGVIWKTADSGFSWNATGVSADQVFGMVILDSLNSKALSGDPEGFHSIRSISSSDGGNNWNFEDLQMYGLSFSLDFRNFSEGWSASGPKFIYTSDTGTTWVEKETPDSSIIYDLQFLNSQSGYAVGDNGVILKYVPPPVSVEEEPSLVDEYMLSQNYPNPFNANTIIKYVIAASPSFPLLTKERDVRVRLKVYDILGNDVAVLVDENKSAGKYEVEFDASGFSSGIYFYQLNAGSYLETKKMILLK